MPVPSFLDKPFVVTDNDALVRNPDLSIAHWQADEPRPEGVAVGDRKRLPKRAVVHLTESHLDDRRNVYVFAEAVEPDVRIPSGWTRATNFEGQLANELLGYRPLDWDLLPAGDNYTVTDRQALLRSGPPRFRSRGEAIPFGRYVQVVERSDTTPPGRYVRVHEAKVSHGRIEPGDELGWTAAANLTDGCSPAFRGDAWNDDQGPNAAWQRGRYLGPRVLVDLVGVGGEAEQIALHTLEPYLKLVAEAAKKHIELALESGFRTYGHQAKLYDLYRRGQGNLAAKPGRSNHQHGQAFDLNTRGFAGTPRYDWLAKNGPKLGFVRTVRGEHWHWEYLPDEAAALAAQGRHKTGTWP